MKYFVFFLCSLLLFNCSKENTIIPTKTPSDKHSIEFVNTLGGSKNDLLNAVVKTVDGGYITLGHTQSNNGDINNKSNESFNFWVLKYDADDTLQWSKNFGGTADDRGADIIQTTDGGFALLGYSSSADGDVLQNFGAKDFWLIKLEANGTISWQKNYGFSGADYGTSLLQTNDNGYLITGVLDVTSSGGQGNAKSNAKQHAGGDVWAIKLNTTGHLEWSKYYGGSFTDTPLGVIQTADNSYILAGSSDSNDVDIKNNKGSYDFWVVKIANDGNLIWEKSFGGSEIDEARGIITTNDGNFVIVGDTRSADKDVRFNNGAADIWMIKINTDGNLIWEKTFGGTAFDVARSITKTLDNGFLISGSSQSTDYGFTNQGRNDALIAKVNSEGVLEWQKTVGGSEIDFLYDAVELNDKSIIAVGESSSANGDVLENKGFSDALIIKIK